LQVHIQDYQLYINGEWKKSKSDDWIEVQNPATEEVIARVPKGTKEDAKDALDAASDAQPAWEDLSPLQRSEYLFKIADLITEDRERLAKILTLEEGKPLFESRFEIDGAAADFRYYAGYARRLTGDALPSDFPKQSISILKLPIGVVVSITPWNFPSSTVARKLAPALIAGNTVVTKPSSNTPLSTVEIIKLSQKAGLPKGVLNMVTGSGSVVGDELVANKNTGLVTMTGSTEAGKKIMASAASHVAKVILELGGKAPLIVWGDADFDWALKCAIWARFWNCGQTCISAERMYIDSKIKDRFLSAYVAAARSLKMGDPLSPSTDLGPMVSKDQLATSMKFIEIAKQEDDKFLTGGTGKPRGFEKGYYFEPAVIEVSKQDSPLMQEEIFGPVLPFMAVDDFDEAIDLANDSRYGLSSYIFTRDASRVMKAMHKIKFGESYINQIGPEQLQGAHTGFRQSGIGAEGSTYGLECYTQLKTNYIDWAEKPDLPYLFPYGTKNQ
jgi:acyl-CoA reductase-like NAD-dependent aldehyde dehydrogenase